MIHEPQTNAVRIVRKSQGFELFWGVTKIKQSKKILSESNLSPGNLNIIKV